MKLFYKVFEEFISVLRGFRYHVILMGEITSAILKVSHLFSENHII